MAKNPKKISEHALKIKKNISKNIIGCLKIQKILHEFYNQFVKFQNILTYIWKILKTFFWIEIWCSLLI